MIKYCRNCVYPETKPDLSLDENGICDACRFVDVKDSTDWILRKKELETKGKFCKKSVNWKTLVCILKFLNGIRCRLIDTIYIDIQKNNFQKPDRYSRPVRFRM